VSKPGRSAGGDRLKIAYMVGTFPALTETFILREIGALRRRGIDILVLAIRRPSYAQAAAGALGADATCLYARPDSLVRHAVTNVGFLIRRPRRYLTALWTFLTRAAALRPRAALQLLYHFFAGVGFSHDLRRLGASHVHGHWASPTSMALAAHLVDDTPFSFTVHASDDLFVEPVLLGEKSACARFVVAESDYAQRYLDAVTDFRFAEKLHRVYNGLSLGETERLSAIHQGASRGNSVDGRQPLIVSVGTLVHQKGHATLIQVCARLKAQGRAFRCRIIGQGPQRATLERLIHTYRLQDHVTLLGPLPLDRVYAELLEADVFAFLAEIGPSGSRDGFPTVVLEAMAAGLPVLSTTLVGIPEMVLDGVTGVLVPERNIDAATRALERLLESADLRGSMGLAGQARVRELFNLDDSADKLAALLSRTQPAATVGSSG
jgi:colanic acid/amylovoran biosynthesis glycosyltransferase